MKHRIPKIILNKILKKYAEKGLQALKDATPKDTSKTSSLWEYEILDNTIIYKNNNINNGIPIVLLLQYGHATKNGGYIQPNDFINPAIKSIFDQIIIDYWQEVRK